MPAEPYPQIAGPSYATESFSEAVDASANFYFEANEIPYKPKGPSTLYQRPGSKPFGAIPTTIPGAVRAQMQFDGNGVPDGAMFGVSGSTFWQMNPDGSVTTWGTVVNDGKPAKIDANAASVGQIGVSSAGHFYVLSGGVFAEIPNDGINFFGARDFSVVDGYGVVLSDTTNNQQFQISALNDLTMWAGLDIALLLGQSDPLQRVIVNIEYLYFIGTRRGEIWYNSGNALFPFVIESGAFLETGTNAPGSVCKASSGTSTTAYWMGQDARGANYAVRASGLQVDRISNHAVEAAWSNKDPLKFNGIVYPTTDDCICYPFTWNGHEMVRFIFPSAGTGWDYDVTESARVGFKVWNPVNFTLENGTQTAPFERAHAYAFGLHLIGSGGADGLPGQIYAMDQQTYADCAGSPFGQLITAGTTGQSLDNVLAADTEIDAVLLAGQVPAAPFYLIYGGGPAMGGELILCTVITGPVLGQYTLTVIRAQGGSTAQEWDSPAAFSVVTLPGFVLTRDRIFRLPFNNGLRVILDRLEVFGQPGTGVSAANTLFSAGATLGSATYTVADTTGLTVGQEVTGDCVPPGSTIETVNINTSIVLVAGGESTQTGTFVLKALDPTAGANPVLSLRISRDGGQSWGTELQIPMGAQGETYLRWIINRLGYYRDGAIWLRCTDPVFLCLVGGALGIRRLAS
jgi:hypothetical protein